MSRERSGRVARGSRGKVPLTAGDAQVQSIAREIHSHRIDVLTASVARLGRSAGTCRLVDCPCRGCDRGGRTGDEAARCFSEGGSSRSRFG
ncbi:hypothetical protein FAGKG844_50014 [Frankia sp. AgKG'84/4]